MQNYWNLDLWCKRRQLTGPVNNRDFRETGPWPLGRNYVIINKMREPKINSSNALRIRIFLFRSYSFGIEPINTFIHSRSSSKTIPDSRPKWAKSIAVLGRPKGPKNLTLWGCTYLCRLYKGILRGYPLPSRRRIKLREFICRIILRVLKLFPFGWEFLRELFPSESPGFGSTSPARSNSTWKVAVWWSNNASGQHSEPVYHSNYLLWISQRQRFENIWKNCHIHYHFFPNQK